jgi:hypothetical protein
MSDEAADAYFPDAKKILCSEDFLTYPMAEKYRLLQNLTGIDFSATVSFLEKLPVFLDGSDHKILRRELAIRLASTKAEQEAAMERTLAELMDTHFSKNGTLDLVADFSMPLWRALSRCLTKLDDSTYALIDELTSLSFFPTLSIKRRKKINDRLADLLKDAGNDDLLAIVLITLGFRPFSGSIALSVYELAQKFEAVPLSEYEYPDDYPVSSIPYTERLATVDSNVTGRTIARDRRVRCFIHNENYETAINDDGLYGFGKHVCLGRPISQFVMGKMISLARQYHCRLTPLRLEMMKHTEPFFLPQIAEVKVSV